MVPNELVEQVRTEVKRLNEVQADFLQTYKQLCLHYGGPQWQEEGIEGVFHNVRKEIIPIMRQSGMDAKDLDALCSWAAKRLMNG
ncbi:MAG TPA: hypothetical protein VN688_34185 [Gemmataceae bacterium]|nr:hypothetical protein [Gemmataceae bacterium]